MSASSSVVFDIVAIFLSLMLFVLVVDHLIFIPVYVSQVPTSEAPNHASLEQNKEDRHKSSR